jgi:hypothetical protein
LMRVPTTKVVLIGKQPVMLIERFDRYWATTGTWRSNRLLKTAKNCFAEWCLIFS